MKKEPISSHDKESLKKYFEKNIPDPSKSFEWKIIKLGDYFIEHKRFYIRWPGTLFTFVFLLPIYLIKEHFINWMLGKKVKKSRFK